MIALYSRYVQNTTNIPHNIKFYTQYTHPTLICRGTDARTDGQMDNIYSIFRDKFLLLGEHVLLYAVILHVLLQLFRRRSRPNAVFKNVTIPWPPEMSPMLVTEGKSDQTAAHTVSRQCVEGACAGARASNDQKPTIRGAVG